MSPAERHPRPVAAAAAADRDERVGVHGRRAEDIHRARVGGVRGHDAARGRGDAAAAHGEIAGQRQHADRAGVGVGQQRHRPRRDPRRRNPGHGPDQGGQQARGLVMDDRLDRLRAAGVRPGRRRRVDGHRVVLDDAESVVGGQQGTGAHRPGLAPVERQGNHPRHRRGVGGVLLLLADQVPEAAVHADRGQGEDDQRPDREEDGHRRPPVLPQAPLPPGPAARLRALVPPSRRILLVACRVHRSQRHGRLPRHVPGPRNARAEAIASTWSTCRPLLNSSFVRSGSPLAA